MMLLPDEYFKIYGENLSQFPGRPKEAWDATEKEFNRRYSCSRTDVVLRRFSSFKSFQVSYNKYKREGWPKSIEVAILVDECDYSKIK